MTLEKLIANFELLGDWEERYGYLIDLGKKLPGLASEEKSEENRVHGCQALVWMVMEPDPERAGATKAAEPVESTGWPKVAERGTGFLQFGDRPWRRPTAFSGRHQPRCGSNPR